MLNFVICDDNLNILDRLEKMLETIFTKNNFEASVGFKSDDPDKAKDSIMEAVWGLGQLHKG